MSKKKKEKLCKNCGKVLENRQSIYCSLKCMSDYTYKEYISEWKMGKKSGSRGAYSTSLHLRKYLFNKFDNKCSICGWSEKNPFTGKIPLEIDHIDGNYLNNKEENLRLLCPNCHSLTSTYKGANKGRGRSERSKYCKNDNPEQEEIDK